MTTKINARVLADSISPDGHRLTTMEVTYPRFVHSEFMTHRWFSRNSESSRAVPFAKKLERVQNDPAFPVSWPAEQKGMQGGDEIDTPWRAEHHWLEARDAAVRNAEQLAAIGVHKSVVNRLLEPFMWHTVIVSATEWDGFWWQRCSPLAQPEIHAAADVMRAAYDTSAPVKLDYGDWHLPLLDGDTITEVTSYYPPEQATKILCQISAARCARVSYLTHEGVRDWKLDCDLYEKLISASPPHASPLEHVATPCPRDFEGNGGCPPNGRHVGNFRGWDQLRHQVLNF